MKKHLLREDDWPMYETQVTRLLLYRRLAHRNPDFVPEVTQDVADRFLKAARSGTFCHNPLAWLVTVVGNAVCDWLRRRNQDRAHYTYLEEERFEVASKDLTPLEVVMNKERCYQGPHLAKELLRVVREESLLLKSRKAALFRDHLFDHQSFKNLAEKYSLDPQSPRRLFHALRKQVIRRVHRRLASEPEMAKLFADLLHDDRGYHESMKDFLRVVEEEGVDVLQRLSS